MVYGDFRDLTRRTVSDKVFRDKSFEIARNPNNDGYQRELSWMAYKVFNRKARQKGTRSSENQELASELDRPMSRKFERHKLYWSYRDDIWGADLEDLQLINKYNKRVTFLKLNKLNHRFQWNTFQRDKWDLQPYQKTAAFLVIQ